MSNINFEGNEILIAAYKDSAAFVHKCLVFPEDVRQLVLDLYDTVSPCSYNNAISKESNQTLLPLKATIAAALIARGGSYLDPVYLITETNEIVKQILNT